jgi:hypothetical protein
MEKAMTNKHISFPSIDQFRTTVKHVNDRCGYQGIVIKPTLRFSGSVKLHGTNASVVYTPSLNGPEDVQGHQLYAQSRSNVITPEDDNAGFARFVAEGATWQSALDRMLTRYKTAGFMGDKDYDDVRPQAKEAHTVVVYGEWCGGSIQKGVALNKLPKMFVVFGIKFLRNGKVVENGEEVDGQISTWLMPWEAKLAVEQCLQHTDTCPVNIKETPIYSIEEFPTWNIDIDFNEPHLAQNKLGELTLAVEQECPVAKQLGVSGIGEGIVWTCIGGKDLVSIRTDDLVFKVKGEKHSVTKVTTLAAVDVEKVNSIKACAEIVATVARFEQALDVVKQANPGQDVLDMKFMGPFLKWVSEDVLKEELDTITENGLEPKEVVKACQLLAKNWFVEQTKL